MGGAMGLRGHSIAVEEDRDIPDYWALLVFDPDGFRLEVFCWPEEDEGVQP
jgi:hypothetical protein